MKQNQFQKKIKRSKTTSNSSVMLHGYLKLIEAFAANDRIWPELIPEVFSSSDMRYIDIHLQKLENAEKSTITSNDDNNRSTESTISLY